MQFVIKRNVLWYSRFMVKSKGKQLGQVSLKQKSKLSIRMKKEDTHNCIQRLILLNNEEQKKIVKELNKRQTAHQHSCLIDIYRLLSNTQETQILFVTVWCVCVCVSSAAALRVECLSGCQLLLPLTLKEASILYDKWSFQEELSRRIYFKFYFMHS